MAYLKLPSSFPLCFQSNRIIYSSQNFAHYYCLTCAESHKAASCLAVWDCSMWLKADTGFLERLPAVKDVWPSHIYKHCVCLWWPEMPGTPVSNSSLSAVRSFGCYGLLHKFPPSSMFHFKAGPKLAIWLITVHYAFKVCPGTLASWCTKKLSEVQGWVCWRVKSI